MALPDVTAEIGRIVGDKYRLLALLGQGGMGAVYAAENTWTKGKVAIKLLRPEYATDRTALRRFMQEAQSATQIAHPNIVYVLDLGLDESGALFMVQELLEGRDLRARLDDGGPLPPTEVLDVMVPILGALAAAHRVGVVHRDLKPENMFLARAPGGVIPKLIDFGVSKVLDAQQRRDKTGAGTAVGTPRYMAPEQIAGDDAVDARADIWSIGVVLYELLSGTCPFAAPTAFAAANRVINETPPALEGALGAIVARAMQRRREDRYASIDEMLDALLELAEAAPLRERHRAALEPPAAVERRVSTPVQFSLVSQLDIRTAPTMAAEPRRRRWLVGVVGLVLVLAALALLMMRRREPPAPVIAAPAPAPPVTVAAPALKPEPVVQPAPPLPPTKTRPAKRPRPPEGANRAPIVE